MSNPLIRIAIPHPALPAYRIPVFRELNQRGGLHVRVLYGADQRLPNVDAAGFEATYAPLWEGRLLGQTVYWHSAQWRAVDPQLADVVVLDWNARYLSLIPALLRAKARGVATVLWGHGRSKNEVAWRNWGRRSVARLATAIVFYDATTASQFTLQHNWDARCVFVAPNALDQGPIQAARQHWLRESEQLAAFRKEHHLDDASVILFVSRLDAKRRADLLLEAAAQLKKTRRIIVLVIGEGEERPHLEQLAKSLGLADNVRFLGAIYDSTQLAPWFLSSDVFCFPADMGLSILQAFGYGLPVVTTGGPQQHGPEIAALRDGQNGIRCPRTDVHSLSEALARILDDPALRAAMSEAALETVTREFSLPTMVDGLEAAIRFAVANTRRHNMRDRG